MKTMPVIKTPIAIDTATFVVYLPMKYFYSFDIYLDDKVIGVTGKSIRVEVRAGKHIVYAKPRGLNDIAINRRTELTFENGKTTFAAVRVMPIPFASTSIVEETGAADMQVVD